MGGKIQKVERMTRNKSCGFGAKARGAETHFSEAVCASVFQFFWSKVALGADEHNAGAIARDGIAEVKRIGLINVCDAFFLFVRLAQHIIEFNNFFVDPWKTGFKGLLHRADSYFHQARSLHVRALAVFAFDECDVVDANLRSFLDKPLHAVGVFRW